MNLSNTRREVMQTLEKSMDEFLSKYLKPIEEIWQPQELLPDSNGPQFINEIQEIQELARELDNDLLTVLIGDTITEEALPTYEAWLMDIEGVDQQNRQGWSRWVRGWTSEENRHGDLLNKYLYLSGRVNMREVEISTQHLINDGVDIHTAKDPYRSFVYTSFQELATNISHRRVALLAKKSANTHLAKMCSFIAADENRHAGAYKHFVSRIFELDPSEMMLAFEDMMKKKIIMPAHYLRESGGKIGELFAHFSDAAQRTMVYTTQDYIDIMNSLIKEWNIDHMRELNDSAEKARDYIMGLPARLQRISERMKIPENPYQFKWITV
ncbi:MAG: fatty acid desaturase [Bacteroidetes bacterium GWF2_41_31]|nr:MAG: fatty acid desaturase [Bacteroidetes bacterium GWF2_41_31]